MGITAVAEQLSTYSDFLPTLSRGVGVRREGRHERQRNLAVH